VAAIHGSIIAPIVGDITVRHDRGDRSPTLALAVDLPSA
jgi:hypothetical protein